MQVLLLVPRESILLSEGALPHHFTVNHNARCVVRRAGFTVGSEGGGVMGRGIVRSRLRPTRRISYSTLMSIITLSCVYALGRTHDCKILLIIWSEFCLMTMEGRFVLA